MSESSSINELVTLIGVAIPLMTIAGSGVAFLIKYYAEAKLRRNEQFFELMGHIDNPNIPLASKLAAVYQLRSFPEHQEFIVRFCTNVSGAIAGPTTEILQSELRKTAEYFEGK